MMLAFLIMTGWSTVAKEAKKKSESGLFDWTFKTGDALYATPLVRDATIYFGSRDSYFYALDSRNGQEKWRFKTEQPIHSTACAYRDRVYFESGNTLYSLSESGKLIW